MPYIITMDENGNLSMVYEKKEPVIRTQKGHSLLKFPTEYTIIDLETTGLNPEFDEIIEVAAIKVRNQEITDVYSSLVKPMREIDAFIEELTGITNAMLADAPSLDDILPEYMNFLSNDILIGHNVSFDINFLYDNLLSKNLPLITNDYVDTLRLSRKIYPEWKHHRLKDLVKNLNIDISSFMQFHRALGDCGILMACTAQMMNDVVEKYGTIESFENQHQRKNYHKAAYKAGDITSTVQEYDTSNPFYGKVCVFTGTLERMLRKDAMQLVVNHGATCGDNVTKQTNYLILGNNDYCKSIKDGKSNKQKKAEQYKLQGYDIDILPEDVFYDMLEINFDDTEEN